MNHRVPTQGNGRVVVWALPIVVAATLCTQVAHSFNGSLTLLPTESRTTLTDSISPQNLDLQKTVIDFVDSGILLGIKPSQIAESKPKAALPKTATPLPKPVLKQPQSPKSQAPKLPATEAPTKVLSKTPQPIAQASPFQKWVKPKSIATDKVPVAKVARRLPKPTPRKPAQLAPKQARKTAVATDRSKQKLTKNIASKNIALKNSVPKLARAATSPAKPMPEVTLTPEVNVTPLVVTPREQLVPLTKSQLALRTKVRSVLTHYYNRPLNTRDRSPWELMHAMLAFEAHSRVLQGGPKGEPITAVGWLCYNQACKQRTLMYVGDEGDLRVRVGPALQGHRGQLLSMLAQSRINENYPMLVEGHELKIADLIDMEKRTCYPRTELTFKLIGLMHYLDSDATWMNDQGMEWNIPRLIAEEIRQPVRGAACGGTHRLSGLTLAYKTRLNRGEPLDGQYLKAKKFVARYQQYAYRMQNRDGSFSTEWFRGPGNENSIDRKFKTTGHILEWLLYAADEKQLHHWRTTKAANYLATIMQRNRYKDWETGPMGHAIHALLVYDRLVFAPHDPTQPSTIARKVSLPWQTQQKR